MTILTGNQAPHSATTLDLVHSALGDASAKLAIIEGEARSALHAAYPPGLWPGVHYDADVWDYAEEGHPSRGVVRFREVARGRQVAPALPAELAAGAKAYLASRNIDPSVGETVIGGVRHLWAYLRHEHGWTDFRWGALRPVLLEGFASFMEREVGPTGRPLARGTRAIREVELNAMLEWLGAHGLISTSCQVTRSATQEVFAAGRREDRADMRRSRLPDRRAIEALAELYTRATDPAERLLLALCGILTITGLRESEVRDLPADCLEVEAGPHGERVRFRYWNRKPAGSTYYYAQRWLSPLAGELAKRLIAEVLELTKAARAVAEALEAGARHPGLSLFGDREMLTRAEAARVLGFTNEESLKATSQSYAKSAREHPYTHLRTYAWVGPRPDGGAGRRSARVGYRLADVEAILAARQAEHPLVAYKAPDGSKQPLSQTLFCIPDDLRHLGRPVAVRKMARGHIADFLQGRSSVFARRFDDERRELGLRTHGFRHWLNTLANKAGLSVFLITVWMQRRNELHTHSYLWDAPDLADLARHDILDNRMIAGVADVAAALPATEREAYVEATVTVAHVGPGGLLCTQDIVSDECHRQQGCPGCGRVLAERGNAAQEDALRAKAADAEELAAYYQELALRGVRVVGRQTELAREAAEAASHLAGRIGGDHAA